MLISFIWKMMWFFSLRRWRADVDLVEEVCGTFGRDGRLADFGEELGVIALIMVDNQQNPGADTHECGVLLRRHTVTQTPFSFSFRRKTSVG